MNRGVQDFVQEAIDGSRARAIRDAVEIARLEREITQLEMLNQILIEKLEWFANHVKTPEPPRRVDIRPDGVCRLCVCGQPVDQPCQRCHLEVAG